MEERIHRYLSNSMDENEKISFEKEMVDNADLRKSVMLEKLINEGLETYRSEAGIAHAKALTENIGDDLFTNEETTTFEIDIDVRKKETFSFQELLSTLTSKKVYIPTLLAACLIFAVFSVQYFQTNNGSIKNPNELGFTEDKNNTTTSNKPLEILLPETNQIYKSGSNMKIQLNKKVNGVKLLIGTKSGNFKKELNNIFDHNETYTLSLKGFPTGKYSLIIQADKASPQMLNFEVK